MYHSTLGWRVIKKKKKKLGAGLLSHANGPQPACLQAGTTTATPPPEIQDKLQAGMLRSIRDPRGCQLRLVRHPRRMAYPNGPHRTGSSSWMARALEAIQENLQDAFSLSWMTPIRMDRSMPPPAPRVRPLGFRVHHQP